ncbi:MAG: radical SAM protein [Candidatus Hydrogenedentota bacterium]|nr:MAG: radical SAM protein [Candidatus Hydrogenedentota bacterium]
MIAASDQPKLDTGKKTITVNEIFYSIEGEGIHAGLPTIFIRMTGCPLRCSWCDTEYAFYEGEPFRVEHILNEIRKYPCSRVKVTGGEPLAQKNCKFLLDALLANGYEVFLETSGSFPIASLPKQVHIAMDLKAPDSKMEFRNLYENLHFLKETDEIKIVIASYKDFLWAEHINNEYKLYERKQPVILQPAYSILDPSMLAGWIKNSKFPFRLGLQLHKIIFPDQEKGV